jgi:hypothetical protein
MTPKEIGGFAYLCEALNGVDSPNACSVLDSSMGEFLEHCQLRHDPRYKVTWDKSYANELGKLCQGIGIGTKPGTKCVDGTNTFFMINYDDIPKHKQKEICHTLVVCEVRPEKDDPDCTRITIGGSKICYPGDISTNMALLELVKILLNSVLSHKGACFSCINLKNFYLDTPMPDPEYVRVKLSDILAEFIEENKLAWRDRDGWICFEIRQGAMVFPRPGSSQMISSPCALLSKGITKQRPHQDFGVTNGATFSSA